MKTAIPKEIRPGETRVAASPETVKKFIGLGLSVTVETGAGAPSSFSDADYTAAGAAVAQTAQELYAGAELIFKVKKPTAPEIKMMRKGAVLISTMDARTDKETLSACARQGVNVFAMELMPRISRAQSMDVLSSQSNLAGYRAVIDACYEFGRALPLMMTAAGTIAPAKVCIMGAGVAGLQAIATAKRMGAVVSAFDVRPAVREQVESLGAKFIEVDSDAAKDAETKGGYAREMSEDYKRKQAEVIAETMKKQDIVICTALIPGRKAPVLITGEMVRTMKAGAVIVDLASEMGGNCELAEHGRIVEKHGVKIIGHDNVPGRLAHDASQLYAKNVLTFFGELFDRKDSRIAYNMENEIIKGTLAVKDGAIAIPELN
ncbi:MAG: Re/Si-specific NAD(P)(+) transhydrogenase subunit alpha [Elusimicrobiaceae bacterium]|nr:Re/Si-specific NAD(P)(+) transhydrogenase subunit alpha [Elusimicrobiaceae bacterium]